MRAQFQHPKQRWRREWRVGAFDASPRGPADDTHWAAHGWARCLMTAAKPRGDDTSWELVGVSRGDQYHGHTTATTRGEETQWWDPCVARLLDAVVVSWHVFLRGANRPRASPRLAADGAAALAASAPAVTGSNWLVSTFLQQELRARWWITFLRLQRDLQTPPERWLLHERVRVLGVRGGHSGTTTTWLWLRCDTVTTFLPPAYLVHRLPPRHLLPVRGVMTSLITRVWVLHRALQLHHGTHQQQPFWDMWRANVQRCWLWLKLNFDPLLRQYALDQRRASQQRRSCQGHGGCGSGGGGGGGAKRALQPVSQVQRAAAAAAAAAAATATPAATSSTRTVVPVKSAGALGALGARTSVKSEVSVTPISPERPHAQAPRRAAPACARVLMFDRAPTIDGATAQRLKRRRTGV